MGPSTTCAVSAAMGAGGLSPLGVAGSLQTASPSTLSPDAALVVDPGTSHRRAQFLKQHSSQQSDDSSHSAGG